MSLGTVEFHRKSASFSIGTVLMRVLTFIISILAPLCWPIVLKLADEWLFARRVYLHVVVERLSSFLTIAKSIWNEMWVVKNRWLLTYIVSHPVRVVGTVTLPLHRPMVDRNVLLIILASCLQVTFVGIVKLLRPILFSLSGGWPFLL